MIDLSTFMQSTGYDKAHDKPDGLGRITPIEIVSDMSKLFLNGEDINGKYVWDMKILDIACKSGNFLRESLVMLMNNQAMIHRFPDENYRREWILNNQLYGAAISDMDEMIATRNVYGQLVPDSHIIKIDNYIDLVKSGRTNILLSRIKEAFGIMQFDRVVGNPPYNNDIYIDFVLLAKELLKKDGKICMITPAKWQAKGGEKNEKFREEIVPYMEKIVSARSGHDIFEVDENAGISYYLIDTSKTYNVKEIKNICTHNKTLQSDFEKHDEKEPVLYNQKILQIIGKVGTLDEGFKQSLYVKNTDHGEKTIADTLGFKRQVYVGEQDRGQSSIPTDYVEVMQGEKLVGYKRREQLYTTYNLDKWKCTCSCMMGYSGMFLGKNKIIGSPYINIIGPNQVPKGSFPVLRYFDTKEEAESFRSYIHSKLVSFLFFLGVCGATVTSEFFRFIPDPVNFDHIFTDEELYKKYNLTEEEIKIIESIIKER